MNCQLINFLVIFPPLELTALAEKSQTFKDALLQTVSQGSLVQEFTDVLKVFVELQGDYFST